MELRTIYRIHTVEDSGGMWYGEDGTLQKKIHLLCPNGIAKDLPMPHNPLHKKDGKVWKSAGRTIEEMRYWFSTEDVISLYDNGFRLYQYKVNEWQDLEHEVLFHRGSVVEKTEIPLSEVWDVEI